MLRLITLLLFSTLLHAAIPDQIKTEIDQRVRHGYNPSIALAIYRAGEIDYYVAGLQNLQKNTPATRDTLYEIGSITKTFTALLLAQAVTQGKLQLSDAVQPHWPEQMQLQDATGQAIQFRHLATHNSGLFRQPINLPLFSDNPYAHYDLNKLQQAFKQPTHYPVGERYMYSNLGYALLAETLARVYQQPYKELLQQSLLQPMKLDNTYFEPPAAQQPHWATGYKGSEAVGHWHFDAFAGAGALNSTIEDLLSYGIHALAKSPEGLSPAWTLAEQQHLDHNGVRVGLGWHFRNKTLWHNGGTAGFSSILLIDPDTVTVIAGLSNTSPQNNMEDIAWHLLDKAAYPLKAHDYPTELSSDTLDAVSGQYHSSENPAQQVELTVRDGKIQLKRKYPPLLLFTPVAEDRLVNAMHHLEIQLQSDASGFILINRLDEKRQQYTRQKGQH